MSFENLAIYSCYYYTYAETAVNRLIFPSLEVNKTYKKKQLVSKKLQILYTRLSRVRKVVGKCHTSDCYKAPTLETHSK